MRRPNLTRLEMQKRRQLAVKKVVEEGLSPSEVAKVLDVSMRSVQLWVQQHRQDGPRGLLAKAHPGRPSKLTLAQEKEVKSWLRQPATDFAFATNLWTGKRIAQLIRDRLGVDYHENYLCQWLARHGFSSQKPARVPRERDEQKIQQWLQQDWPRLVKKGRTKTPIWC